MQENSVNQKGISRPPVVVIMGHIDHGKSTLLDYIRKSNVVAKEAGGITQHLGAYEISHITKSKENKKITFLDTPGHEAFCGVRSRGAKVADIGILIVSAEDGVKTQTKEALDCILADKIPFIVAINKIDSPKANVDTTKTSLIENEIYIEGYGGDIPVVEISAKTGENIDELLETILLMAEMNEFTADLEKNATGFVVEANKDKQKGTIATVVIKDGNLKVSQFIATANAFAPIRSIEDQNKKQIKSATVSCPVSISGWNEMPIVGSEFQVFENKKEAEKFISEWREIIEEKKQGRKYKEDDFIIPIIFKADTHGSLEAIEHELNKIKPETAELKIIFKGTGNISENDIKMASGDLKTVIVGFGVNIDNSAKSMSEKLNIEPKTFKIIYELSDWLKEQIEEKRPRLEIEEIRGQAKILKTFSKNKTLQVMGGKVKEGILKVGNKVKIKRREEEIGSGTIKELQQAKVKTNEVSIEQEFGMSIDSKIELAAGDMIESIEIIRK
jgi:translation initiation factor IF-2